MGTLEIEDLDLRYEDCRLKDKSRESKLLLSITERGIQEPVQCITPEEDIFILLDGYKRFRSAKKLGIATLPYVSISNEAASGILQLIRVSNATSLNILEQARFVDILKSEYQMSASEIANRLDRGKTWVIVRLGILSEMSDLVKREIFSGRFSAYSYTYTLRSFRRLNSIKKSEIDEFVQAVSGKGLSTRSIELLAQGYFKGHSDFRRQIKSGNFNWTLNQLKNLKTDESSEQSDLNKTEQWFINNLEIVQKYMNRIIYKSEDAKLKSATFMAQANLLTGGILSKKELFIKSLEELYARSGAS
jgi:predicted transcriptional regulator